MKYDKIALTESRNQKEKGLQMIDLKRMTAWAVAAIFSVVAAFSADAADETTVTVKTDRGNALYPCGEKATFEVAVTKDDRPLAVGNATVRVSNDGMKTSSTQAIDLAKDNPFKAEGTMTVPGFLQCEVIVDQDKGYGGAGFEPEKIQAVPNLPEDFKAFWEDGIQELDKIPLEVKLEPLPKFSSPQCDCFKISFANIDNTRIYGYLSVPKGKPGPFPALISVPGAGPGICIPDTTWVKHGVIVLFMNVHQYEPSTDNPVENKKMYDALNTPLMYCYQGAPDRDKYYFKKSILGINRAINWLAARPDVDKEHFAMFGSSQGGAFTLIMSGLNKNIKAASANVPALGDHAGYQLDRNPGWPKLVAKGDPEKLKMSGYFDSVNFARSITCPMILSVGFIDPTCSPSSVYSIYNTIQAPKMIFNEPNMGHSSSKRFSEYQQEWLRGKLGLAKETPPVSK
jgi:cephalosporin-C deacetylase-like acetyl esterase